MSTCQKLMESITDGFGLTSKFLLSSQESAKQATYLTQSDSDFSFGPCIVSCAKTKGVVPGNPRMSLIIFIQQPPQFRLEFCLHYFCHYSCVTGSVCGTLSSAQSFIYKLSCNLRCSYLFSSIRTQGLAFGEVNQVDNQRKRGAAIAGFGSC